MMGNPSGNLYTCLQYDEDILFIHKILQYIHTILQYILLSLSFLCRKVIPFNPLSQEKTKMTPTSVLKLKILSFNINMNPIM